MILDRALREVDLLDQQQKTLHTQSTQLYHDAAPLNTPAPHHLQPEQALARPAAHKTASLPFEPSGLQFVNGLREPARESAPDQAALYKLYQSYYQNDKATEDL